MTSKNGKTPKAAPKTTAEIPAKITITADTTTPYTPRPIGTALFWIAAAALGIGLLWLFEGILLPFVLGALIAYLLNPLITPFEKRGAPRWLCAIAVLAVFFTGVGVALLLLIPIVYQEVSELANNMPAYIQTFQGWLSVHLERLSPYIAGIDQFTISDKIKENAGQAIDFSKQLLGGILAGTQAVMGFASTLFLTPIVAFYMMADWHSITKTVRGLYPKAHTSTIERLLNQIDRSIAGFIRGQISVCALLGLIYGVALIAMGLKFGFVIGLTSGILSFIPFVGSAFGLVASVAVAWFQFGTLAMVGLAFGIFVVGQMIEGNILTPKLVGGSIQLHPLWIIFSLMAGGSLFGFTGMLIALPVAAVVGVLVRFFVERYKASAFYNDGRGAPQVTMTETGPRKGAKPASKSAAKDLPKDTPQDTLGA